MYKGSLAFKKSMDLNICRKTDSKKKNNEGIFWIESAISTNVYNEINKNLLTAKRGSIILPKKLYCCTTIVKFIRLIKFKKK